MGGTFPFMVTKETPDRCMYCEQGCGDFWRDVRDCLFLAVGLCESNNKGKVLKYTEIQPLVIEVCASVIISDNLSHGPVTIVQFVFLTPQVPHFLMFLCLYIISVKTFLKMMQRWQ